MIYEYKKSDANTKGLEFILSYAVMDRVLRC